MATLNKHTSLLAAILSTISDDSDTNFIYVLSANECQQRNNDDIKYVRHVTEAAGSEVFDRSHWLSLEQIV